MNRSLRTAALLSVCLGLAPTALAAETPRFDVPYVFETVDGYAVLNTNRVEVTGLLRGESAQRTLVFYFTTGSTDPSTLVSRCDRMALLAMNKPGLYFFEMTQGQSGFTSSTCRLTRR
ncbi:hypothetical protein JY651_49665 [Pyxidicoccus parkwayensis]|uniref:Secreted protein n=1 Tax=Pyxidicoccus parkwayensis TaxID=2813578 RepID=A0ABX7NVW9_9BACT|nr:hypothetical protein [Pyxidicoccus parkwaysis]QSQ23072.1 hypothetical protein JY651_49665 [Pyxidicoccus parkwaysis]